jgi:hypothetical protein
MRHCDREHTSEMEQKLTGAEALEALSRRGECRLLILLDGAERGSYTGTIYATESSFAFHASTKMGFTPAHGIGENPWTIVSLEPIILEMLADGGHVVLRLSEAKQGASV